MAGFEGTRLGDYELVERIGSGGMAEVYRARQLTAFGREVAIKVIRPGFSEREEFRARFLREAQAISRLSHPNILPLIEFGEENQTLYLVMPLVREGTLRDLIKQHAGPLPLDEALPLFIQLCKAVHYAHTQGIIHRDLKPQNVLLQQGAHVLLADFGIARDRAATSMTATGAGVGSVEYMAPEQALGQVDTRSDIYSLGVVLYQMLTGVVPYSGSTPLQVLMKLTNDPIPDPRTLNPALSPRMVQALQTTLAKDPSARFQSAQALGRVVQQLQSEDALSPLRPSAPVWPPPSGPVIRPPAGEPFSTNPASSYAGPSARPWPGMAPPSGSVHPFSQPIGGPTLPATEAAQSPRGSARLSRALAPTAPGFGAGPGAGAPGKPAPWQNKRSLIALISIVALVVLLGASLLTLGLTHTGPFAAPVAQDQATPTAASIPPGFKLYTNSDHSFRLIYPDSWSMKASLNLSGTGVQFNGPSSLVALATNGGSSQPGNDGPNADAFCATFGGTINPRTTVTIAGQKWTQEQCDSFASVSHALVETIIYKGDLYLLSFAAPPDTFANNLKQYFTPMENSFTFLH